MNRGKSATNLLTMALSSVMLLVLPEVAAPCSAQNQNQKQTRAPASRGSQARPATRAPHATRAQHQGGNPSGAPRPGAPSGANRGSNGASANRPGTTGGNNVPKVGPGGANANRGAQVGANKGAPANANNRVGQTGANKSASANANNRIGQTGANKSAPANANNRVGQAGTNKSAPANANNRVGQTGANKNVPPNANNRVGQTAVNTGGPAIANRGSASRPNNAGIGRLPAGSRTVALKQGGSAVYRQNGQVRTIQTRGMTINRGLYGNTRIVSTQNGRTVVGYGRGMGYSQRSYYSSGSRVYVQRTYYSGGRYYAYGFRSYTWGGRPYYAYAPPYYWRPAYYGWAYRPWPAPVYYRWGWGGAPWYGYYGPYFAPYPVYPMAAFWLTDFLIAANLQVAYAAQQASQSGETGPRPLKKDSANEIASLWPTDPLLAANLRLADGAYLSGAEAAASGNAPSLSPEVKQAIADELKEELATEQAAAAGGQKDTSTTNQVPAALDPKIRIFVVSSELDLTTSGGTECGLTPGDVVYRTGDNPDSDNMVDATVKSSKKNECAVGATVAVDTADLQEMHNQLRIQMDAGLKELAEKQGKDGIPAAPDTKTEPSGVPAPKPDTNVESELQQQQKEAALAEAQLPN